MKKLFAIVLTFVFLLTLLVSCTPKSNTQKGEKVRLENVYTAEEFSVPDKLQSVRFFLAGDAMYIYGSRETKALDENGNEYSEYPTVVFKTDKNFSNFTELYVLDQNENEWHEEEQYSVGSYVNSITGTSDGGTMLLYNEWRDDWSDPNEYKYEQSWSMEKRNAAGESEYKVKINLGRDDVYINNLTHLKDGNFLAASYDSVYILSPEGEVVSSCEDQNNINSTFVTLDGRILLTYYNDEWKMVFGEFFPEQNKVEDIFTLEGNSYTGTFIVSPDGRLYMNDSYDINEFDVTTGKKIKPVLNWINSDINSNFVWDIGALGNEEFITTDNSDWEHPKILKLTPAGEVVEKYVLTFGTLELDYDLKAKIIEFNRSQKEHRISVKTYSEWDNETGENLGIQKLDMDIVQGRGPDIISLNSLDAKKYAAKGLLADLEVLMKEDGEYSKDDFLPGIIEYGTFNGKLRSLVPQFSIESLVAKKSIVGDRVTWTWDEMFKLLEQYPESVAFADMQREDVLRNVLRSCVYDFIDYETGMCTFDSAEFARLLEFCKPYPATIDWDTYYQDYDWSVREQQYKDGKILFQTAWISGPWDIAYSMDSFKNTFGEEVSYIGYPTNEGSGSVINSNLELAIMEKSIYKDVAFDFIKKAVEYDQDAYYQIPSLKDALDQSFETVLEQWEQSDEPVVEEPVIDDDFIGMPSPKWEEPKLTREEVESIKKFISSVSKRDAGYNSEIIDIIVEESAAFFDGKKDIKETCKIIQSRVFLIVTENM